MKVSQIMENPIFVIAGIMVLGFFSYLLFLFAGVLLIVQSFSDEIFGFIIFLVFIAFVFLTLILIEFLRTELAIYRHSRSIGTEPKIPTDNPFIRHIR